MSFQLPIPERIPLLGLLGAAFGLLVLQIASGTDHVFAYLVFVITLLTGVAFNLLGGATTVLGISVAAMMLKFVTISQLAKLVRWEPAHLRLESPIATAGVIAVGMAGICLAAWVTRQFGSRRYLFHHSLELPSLRSMAILVFAVGLVASLGSIAVGGGEEGGLRVGGLAGVLRQFVFCMGFSVVISTSYVILSSHGTRCLSWFNGVPIAISFGLGLITASKQGMFEPLFYLAMAAWAFQFRIRWLHVATTSVLLIVAVEVLYPFAQQARNEVRGLGFKETLIETGNLLQRDLGSRVGFSEMHEKEEASGDEAKDFCYFEGASGFLERISLIKMVDLLVSATLQNGTGGSETVLHGFKMLPPRFLYPQKPVWNTGQILGHRAGMLADDDESTQISFGFIADAFGAYSWTGAFVISFAVALGFFLVFRALLGPLAGNAWSVYFATQFQHTFTEATIASMVLEIFYRPLIYIGLYLGITAVLRVWQLIHEERALRRAGDSAQVV